MTTVQPLPQTEEILGLLREIFGKAPAAPKPAISAPQAVPVQIARPAAGKAPDLSMPVARWFEAVAWDGSAPAEPEPQPAPAAAPAPESENAPAAAAPAAVAAAVATVPALNAEELLRMPVTEFFGAVAWDGSGALAVAAPAVSEPAASQPAEPEPEEQKAQEEAALNSADSLFGSFNFD